MDEMKEIIDEKTVELIMTAVLIGGPCLGLLIGAVVGLIQRQFGKRALQGLGLGCFGILNWFMWKYYSWMVRYDPETGYVGLHKVSVLLINVAVFVAVGALIGIAWGLLARRGTTRQPEPTPSETPQDA